LDAEVEFYLIRHGLTDAVGRSIAGRSVGVHLNAAGVQQVERLADSLGSVSISAIYSSPLERAAETARPLADHYGLQVQTAMELNEIDFGQWTGCEFDALQEDPHWVEFNSLRSCTRAPGGETMLEVQARIVNFLVRLASTDAEPADRTIILVSHGDVIKAAVMYVLGMPLDLFLRLEISPASVSCIRFEGVYPKLLVLNRTCG
jgi:probable phosphoglycerate mutase